MNDSERAVCVHAGPHPAAIMSPRSLPEYLDQHGIQTKLFPVSRTTLWRLMRREKDPFPAPTWIGSKRYWQTAQALAWLRRQGGEA